MPSVTLIIPTLHSSAFIQQTVRHYHSLVADVDAIIIVDDYSADDTYSILTREIAALQSPIQAIRLTENCGQLIAYQAGTSLARTDIVIHCDDDVLLSREDLLRYIESYTQSGAILHYGMVSGKSDHPKGRSTFYWLVRTFVLYRLRDQQFSSLCIYSRSRIEAVYRRAWGFHGNLFTPWIFYPQELSHVSLDSGSQVLAHPSRYSLRGYVQHQKFLLLMLCRLGSLACLIVIGSCMLSGVLRTNGVTILLISLVATSFLLSSIFLKVKSKLRFEIGERS